MNEKGDFQDYPPKLFFYFRDTLQQGYGDLLSQEEKENENYKITAQNSKSLIIIPKKEGDFVIWINYEFEPKYLDDFLGSPYFGLLTRPENKHELLMVHVIR